MAVPVLGMAAARVTSVTQLDVTACPSHAVGKQPEHEITSHHKSPRAGTTPLLFLTHTPARSRGNEVPKIVVTPGRAAVPLAELCPQSPRPCATATMVKCLVRIKTRVSVHLWLINHCCRGVRVRVLALGPRLLSRALGILPLLPAGHGDPPEPGNAAPRGWDLLECPRGSPGAVL